MSASAAYDHHVSFRFPPRFLETELPLDGRLTAEMAAGFPAELLGA